MKRTKNNIATKEVKGCWQKTHWLRWFIRNPPEQTTTPKQYKIRQKMERNKKQNQSTFLFLSRTSINNNTWPCCFTSTEARLLIRDGDRGRKRAREWRLDRGYRPKKTGETVDRCQNNGSVKAVSPRHCPATTALRRVKWTMSVALLLRNNPKRKKSNFRSPAPPPYSWSLLG